jgi:adenosylhomocysteine nucleosidase
MSSNSQKAAALVVTALPLELDAVKHLFGDCTAESGEQGMRYVVTMRADRKIVLFATGAGNVNAAIEVERAIVRYNPRYLFFVGVAGGLKDVSLGDVIAATKIYNYESGKSAKDFLARPQMGESNYYLVQLAYDIASTGKWREFVPGTGNASAFVAPLVAGEKVISSLDAAELTTIRTRYSDALGLEMEGYGVLRVAYSRETVRMIVLRGISDLLAGKDKVDAGGSQLIASANAAAFALTMLDRVFAESKPIDQAAWLALERLLVELYPTGPTQSELWSRAKGDVAMLHLGQTGKADWHSALQQLRLGGGGAQITVGRLVECVIEDFPKNSSAVDIQGMLD